MKTQISSQEAFECASSPPSLQLFLLPSGRQTPFLAPWACAASSLRPQLNEAWLLVGQHQGDGGTSIRL